MLSEEDEKLKTWEEKRTKTICTYALYKFALGMEYSLTFATLWLYLNTLVETSSPKLFYSLISASFHINGFVLTLIAGRVVDKYRNARTIYLMTTTLMAIGNFIYAIPFSPYYVLVGRFLSGAGVAIRPVCAGEIARCYDTKEMVRVTALQGASFGLGLTLGPALNFAFLNVDFYIGKWHLTYVNSPAVFLGIVFLAMDVLIFFTVYDLSKEFDLKAYLQESQTLKPRRCLSLENFEFYYVNEPSIEVSRTDINESNSNRQKGPLSANHNVDEHSSDQEISEEPKASTNRFEGDSYNEVTNLQSEYEQINGIDASSSNHEQVPNIGYVLHKLLTNFDSCFVMFMTFIVVAIYNSSDMWLPILVTDTLGWSIKEVNAIFFGSGIASAILAPFIAFKKPSAKVYYRMNLAAIIGLILIEAIYVTLKLYHSNLWQRYSLQSLYVVTTSSLSSY